jgi:hypothetical protein
MPRFFEVFKLIFLKVFSGKFSRQAKGKRGCFRRGQQHGLEIDSELLSTYGAVDAATNGLDQIRELWNVLWGIPAVRCCPLTGYPGISGMGHITDEQRHSWCTIQYTFDSIDQTWILFPN